MAPYWAYIELLIFEEDSSWLYQKNWTPRPNLASQWSSAVVLIFQIRAHGCTPTMGSSNISQTTLIVYRRLSVCLISLFFFFILLFSTAWNTKLMPSSFRYEGQNKNWDFFCCGLCCVKWRRYLFCTCNCSLTFAWTRTLSVISIPLSLSFSFSLCFWRWASRLCAIAFVFFLLFSVVLLRFFVFCLLFYPLFMFLIEVCFFFLFLIIGPELKIQLLWMRGTDSLRRTLQLHLGCPAAACLFIWVCYCCGCSAPFAGSLLLFCSRPKKCRSQVH